MSKELEAVIRISGDIDTKLKSAIDAAVKRLDELEEASKMSGVAVDKLADTIVDQSAALKAAQKQYASYVLAGEKGSDQAKELAQKIKTLSGDLEKNKKAMADAEQAAQKLAKGARNAKEGFSVLKGAMANLVSAGFQKLIGAATDAGRALFDLSEQTREFRQDMSTLETAYDRAGFSAETATSTWRDLYAIFGEDDRAVETANNISRMAKSQQDLSTWVQITTGIWGTYQDALPVEGLAEAAGEAAKVGKVTGVLADALNWSSEAASMFSKYMSEDVTSAEDAFNVALSKCSTEQERQALITETLTALYGDAAKKYEESSGSLMDANRAAADAQIAQGDLGATIEPVTTAWTNLKTELLVAVAPALEKVSGGLQTVIGWMQEHPTVVRAVVAALAVLAVGITAITIAVGIYTGIQLLANAAMLPIIGIALGIVAAIAAVIAIGVAVVKNWDTIKAKAAELGATLAKKFGEMRAAISRAWSGLTNILTAPFRAVANLIETVSGKVSNIIGKISSVGSNIKSKIPFFAAGGFTNGLSIAGEAGTEAVISFDRRYRAQNLAYWAKAGQMLGMDDTFSLSGNTSLGSSYIDLGGVTFAPNITVKGNAKKDDIVAAIRETYPEFLDMLDEILSEREETVYA